MLVGASHFFRPTPFRVASRARTREAIARVTGILVALTVITSACGLSQQEWAAIGTGIAKADSAYKKGAGLTDAQGNPKPSTATGFLKSSVQTGSTRQCTYDVVGALHVKTMKAVDICPITMAFPFP